MVVFFGEHDLVFPKKLEPPKVNATMFPKKCLFYLKTIIMFLKEM